MKITEEMVKQIGDMFATKESRDQILGEIRREQMTSQDFDSTDPVKMQGNMPSMKNMIRDISKNVKTPMLDALESKEVRKENGFMFEMMTEALQSASRDSFKIHEGVQAFNPKPSYNRKENKIMMLGVGIEWTMLVKLLSQNPNPENVIKRRMEGNLKCFSLAKEDFIFNGDRSKDNETDGILTILARESLSSNTGTSLTYSGGALGSHMLIQDDLENLIFSILVDNGGEVENAILWMCQKALRTLNKWSDEPKVYTTPTQFSMAQEVPVYVSLNGFRIPIKLFNEAKISNVNDTVLMLDMSEIDMVRVFDPRQVDMPRTYPMDEKKIAVLDSMGLDFLYTLTSGFISGIDKI